MKRYTLTKTTRIRFEVDANDRDHAVYMAEHPDEWRNIETISEALTVPILIGEVSDTS